MIALQEESVSRRAGEVVPLAGPPEWEHASHCLPTFTVLTPIAHFVPNISFHYLLRKSVPSLSSSPRFWTTSSFPHILSTLPLHLVPHSISSQASSNQSHKLPWYVYVKWNGEEDLLISVHYSSPRQTNDRPGTGSRLFSLSYSHHKA